MSLIIFGILTFRCWHEWKLNNREPTEQPYTQKWKKQNKTKQVSPLVCVIPPRLGWVFFFQFHPPAEGPCLPCPASRRCADTNCRLRWKVSAWRRSGGPEACSLLTAPLFLASLSLHWILMWGGIPVRVSGHVAVGRHVYSFGRGRDVPYWRDGRGARGQGHGPRDGVGVVWVVALLQQLLELRPLILEPNLNLRERKIPFECN